MKRLIILFFVLIALAGCTSNIVAAAKQELPDYKTIDVKEARGVIEITVDGYTYGGKYSEERLQCVYLYSRDTVAHIYKCSVTTDAFILVEINGENTRIHVTGPFDIPIY